MNSMTVMILAAIVFAAGMCWTNDVGAAEKNAESSSSASDVISSLPVIEINEDVHITGLESWRNAHYRISGNVVFHKGGTLLVDNCVVELMSKFARQFTYKWDGGTLISTNSTLGGTSQNGVSIQTYFQLEDGEWYATDTTIQHCYGVSFAWDGRVGKLRAVRLIAGKNPDSIIMGGSGDVVLKDSDYAIALTISSAEGGNGIIDFPVDTPLTQVYDSSNLLGAKFRLELINTKVNFWFLFAYIVDDGPPAEITLANCPRFLPSLTMHNVKGELRLPSTYTGETPSRETRAKQPEPVLIQPHTTFKTGNLTWKVGENPINIFTWGLYLTGKETDITIKGPILICELIIFDAGRVVLDGDEGTHNIWSTCTTIEADFGHVNDAEVPVTVGPDGKPETVRLEMRNVALGRFIPNDSVRGQIGAFGNAEVIIENAVCDDLTLTTKHQGRIVLKNIEKKGELLLNKDGGDIVFEDEDVKKQE